MAPNFIACDREQAFLLPPSLLDWVPQDHVVWTILGAVEEIDLTAFLADYRADGHGRPAYDPAVMLALLLYAYAHGNRSSRGIERECREDVAYMVITGLRVPDHSTIAEFRRRHESALAGVFTGVLKLCRAAGMVKVGLVAVDGTKVHANASHHNNLDFDRLARAILADADRIDREEDERYGDKRGDELPEELTTPEGRRRALRDAKRRLEQEREQPGELEADDRPDTDDGKLRASLELDAAAINAAGGGRRRWHSEARHQLNEHRRQEASPIPRARSGRLLEAERRMWENLAAHTAANAAYEHYRATARDKRGRRLSRPPDPYQPPVEPEGVINTTDPDSRNMQTARGWVQGYNAQAAVSEDYVIIAAEITVESPDFGHLKGDRGIGRSATQVRGCARHDRDGARRCRLLGAEADGGDRQPRHPGAGAARRRPAQGRDRTSGGLGSWMPVFMRRVLASELGGALYRKRQGLIEPVFGDIKFNRRIDRFQRRGRSAALSEWRVVAATHNLLRLHSHQLAVCGA